MENEGELEGVDMTIADAFVKFDASRDAGNQYTVIDAWPMRRHDEERFLNRVTQSGVRTVVSIDRMIGNHWRYVFAERR